MICQNCGRKVFGFWKYGTQHVCSLQCLREQIYTGKISRIPPYVAFPELGILPPNKRTHAALAHR